MPAHHPSDLRDQLGVLDLPGCAPIAAIALPFGRIDAGELHSLATAFTSAGATEVRLSPWRTLYAPIPDRPKALALCTRAQEIGLIIEAGNPLRRVDACPGAPACRSTQRQTRMDARLLSQRLAEAGFSGHLHVSGCAKGCSRPAPADLTFVGDEHGYSIVRNGTARDAPSAWLNATEIDSALDIVAKIGSNRRHE
jgi:precorrin-3B synthase